MSVLRGPGKINLRHGDSPHNRPVTPKTVKHKVGVVAAWNNAEGTQVIYWGHDVLRHDDRRTSWRPRPLSKYWDNMYKELFKNW